MSVAGRRLVLSELLDAPAISAGILGAAAVHVGLSAAGFGGWQCPFFQVTGWPCPGCGLGRACVLLLRGQWWESIRVHAFAPVLILVLALLGAGLVLRGESRDALQRTVKWLEERTAISRILLFGLVVYWLLRFLLDASQWQLVVQ
jgi:hypothetical protein